MTRLSLIEQEPPIGRYVEELTTERRYLDFFPLDDAADLDRLPFFHPDRPQPGIGPHGRYMVDPEFKRYRHDALIATEFADVHVLGSDGIVVLDGGVVKNTLDHIAAWHPDSNVEHVHERAHLRLRQAMPVAQMLTDGRYAIGFTGAWRNHGHWLAQCLPKLFAFTMLRRRFRDMKIVLPPLPPGSAQARTLDLLGIGAEAVYTLAPHQVTCFASAILLPDFDIWTVPNFVSCAADALVARLPSPAEGAAPRPDKIYIHRTVPARSVVNFQDLQPLLARYGFTVVSFEAMDFAEQIATMRAARHVVAEHGAATANILFCPEGTRVLQLFNPFCVEPAFWSLASRRGIDYGYVIGTHHATEAQPHPGWNSDYAIAPRALEDGIRAALRLPPRPLPAPTGEPGGEAAAAPSVTAPPQPPPPAPVVSAPPPTNQAAAAPVSDITGIVEPIFEIVANPAHLGHAGKHERLPIFAPAAPPPQLPMHREAAMPQEFVVEHYHYQRPLTVSAYAVAGAALWGTGLVTLGHQFVAPPEIMPSYFMEHLRVGGSPLHPLHAGSLGKRDVRTIELDHPVAVATHPNLAYGHGLMEVLPRLWLLAVLREYGADLKLALSHTVPDWMKLLARGLHAERDIIWYDGNTERLLAPSLVLPAMLHTDHNFHPAMNLMVRDLVQREPPPAADAPRLIYLAHANFGEEKLQNGPQVEDAMRALGFTVIRPAELSPAQHIRLFAGARMVVGEYGFAMCGTLFCAPGTRVVALNFNSHYLSAIGRLRGHRLAYVPTADGKFHHWRLTRELSRTWSIDVGVAKRIVGEMMEGLA